MAGQAELCELAVRLVPEWSGLSGGSFGKQATDRLWPTVLSGVRAALRPLKNSWFRRTSASWHRAILTLSAITCRWVLRLYFSRRVDANGRFSAS